MESIVIDIILLLFELIDVVIEAFNKCLEKVSLVSSLNFVPFSVSLFISFADFYNVVTSICSVRFDLYALLLMYILYAYVCFVKWIFSCLIDSFCTAQMQ